MSNKLLVTTFRNTIFAILYIFLISQIMINGENWFAGANNTIGSFVILLLFCLSAAVVGGLVFGESVLLFFDNKKKESIKAAIYSVGWLGLYTLFGLFALIMTK